MAGEGVWKAGTAQPSPWGPAGIMGVGGKGNEGITTMVKRAWCYWLC